MDEIKLWKQEKLMKKKSYFFYALDHYAIIK
jgi:hypothetical protein